MPAYVDMYQIKWLQKINLSVVVYQVTRNQVHFKRMKLSVGKKTKTETTTTKTHFQPTINMGAMNKPEPELLPSEGKMKGWVKG